MAVKIYQIGQTRPYTLKRDTGPDPTIFHLTALDTRLAAHLWDNAVAYRKNEEGPEDTADTIKLGMFSRNIEIVRFGLKRWDNLQDAQGNVVEFDEKQHYLQSQPVRGLGNRPGLSDRALNLLKPYIEELAKAIEEENILTEEEKKTSATPPA